jgi:hypothetical protein
VDGNGSESSPAAGFGISDVELSVSRSDICFRFSVTRN